MSVFEEKSKALKSKQTPSKPPTKPKSTKEQQPEKELSPTELKTLQKLSEDGYSPKEIAKMTHLPESQVKTSIKPKEPSRGDLQQMQHMQADGYKAPDIANALKLDISLVKEKLYGKKAKGGRPLKGTEVTKAELVEKLREATDQLKQETNLPTDIKTKKLSRLLGKENIYDRTYALFKGRISRNWIKNQIANYNINLDTDIFPQTVAISAEEPEIKLVGQKPFSNMTDDPDWRASPHFKNVIGNMIGHINDLIALRNANWAREKLKPNAKFESMVQFADFVNSTYPEAELETLSGKDAITGTKNYKPIADWTKDDIYWALNYIDCIEGNGTLLQRVALRRLQFFIPNSSKWGKIGAARDAYKISQYIRDYAEKGRKKGIMKTQGERYQPSKVYNLKAIPTTEQMKKVLHYFHQDSIYSGNIESYPMKKGRVLTKAQKTGLEKRLMLLAIDMFMNTGCRIGSLGETGLRSIQFSKIDLEIPDPESPSSTISVVRMREKKHPEEPIITSKSVLDDMLKFQKELENLGVDTTKDNRIFHLDPTLINNHLRNAAEIAGLTNYTYVYGQKKKVANSPGKYYIKPFEDQDPTHNDPKNYHKQRSLFGHLLTYKDTDIDFHSHLFRAFHFDQLVKAGVSFDAAYRMGVPWESPEIPLKFYWARYAKNFKTEYAKAEDAFKAIHQLGV